MNVDLQLDLHPGQQKVFDSKARFRVVVAGRRFGKSWLALVEAICAALDSRNVQKSPVFLVCPTQPAARTIYWKRAHQMMGLAEEGGLIANSNVNLGIIELITGVEIHIKGADRPDSLRGVGLWFCVIDEVADQKDEVWEVIISPALSDAALYGGGRCLFIGTPKGKDYFFTIAEGARTDDTGEWGLFQFTSADNPFIPQKEIESAIKRMSTAAFRQEYLASFESAGGAVFKRAWFKTGTEPKEGRFYIAVDLAGFEDSEAGEMLKTSRLDETAICVVKVLADKWHVVDIISGRFGVRETAQKIAGAVDKYRPTGLGIEKGALKKAVEPYLREELQKKNCLVPVVALTHGNQEKTDRIVWNLQGRLENGDITWEAGAKWVSKLEDALTQFPNKKIHDDIPDALSYVGQLVNESFWTEEGTESDWSPLDAEVGF